MFRFLSTLRSIIIRSRTRAGRRKGIARNPQTARGVRRRSLNFEALERRTLLSIVPGAVEAYPIESVPPAIISAPDVSQYVSVNGASTHLDSIVADTAQAIGTAVAQGTTDLSGLSNPLIQVTPQGAIQVYVRVDAVTASEIDLLESAGLFVEVANTEMHVVQGWISYLTLDQLDQAVGVQEVSAPGYALPATGAVESAGDTVLKAVNVRSQFASYGIDGTGIKIGVISDGVINRQAAMNSGDLPSTITIDSSRSGLLAKLPGDPYTGDEGTAMLEIVHDLAPAAELYFSGPRTGLEMVDSINWLVGQGCSVIVDDLSFALGSSDPFFSDGAIANAASSAVNSGVSYVSAAGNWQRAYDGQIWGDARSHWQGDFVDAGSGWNNFNPTGNTSIGNGLVVYPNGEVTAALQWSDAWGGSANDYNLYLVTGSGSVLAYSANPQTGSGLPWEGFWWKNFGTSPQVAYLAIQHASGAARELEVFVRATISTALQYTSDDSLVEQNAAVGVINVAAIDSADSPNYNTIEPFSSHGPSTVYTDFATQTSITRYSLSGCGIDDVHTEVGAVGSFHDPFYGTSAAAPHVAAIAALMLQANHGQTGAWLTPAQVTTALDDTATHLATAPAIYDNVYGYGLFNALNAVYNVFTPTAPYLDAGSDSGSQGDATTAVANPTIDGSAPLGSYVGLYVNESLVNSVQLASNQSNYSLSTGTLSPTTYQITVRVGADSSNLSNFSSNFNLTIDAGLFWAGSGQWDASTLAWREGGPTGASVAWANGARAVFPGSATVAIISGFIPQAASLMFAAGTTTTIQGSAITLSRSAAATITVSAGATATIRSTVSVGTGAGPLIVSIPGTLILNGNDGGIPGITVQDASSGTLNFGKYATARNTLPGGNIAFSGSPTNASLVIDTSSGGQTFGYSISGPVTMHKEGNNTLTLSGTNTFNGGTVVILGGSLQLGGSASLTSGVTVIDNAMLVTVPGSMIAGSVYYYSSAVSTIAGNITNNGALPSSVTVECPNGPAWNPTTGALVVDGLILSGHNVYTGGTNLFEGALVVAAPQALPDGGSLTVSGSGGAFGPGATGLVQTLQPSGFYDVGSVLDIALPMGQTVSVAGSPELALALGSNTGYAQYLGGSGTATLLFQYVVQPGDNTAALDYASSTPIVLNGGSILDTSGNPVSLTLPAPGSAGSLSANQRLTINTSDPLVSSIDWTDEPTTNADTVQFAVTFSKPVCNVGVSDFAVSGNGATGTIASVTGSDTHFTVTVSDVSGTGTLGLNLVDDDSIVDSEGHPLGGADAGNGDFTGQTFNIVTTVPWTVSGGSLSGQEGQAVTAQLAAFTDSRGLYSMGDYSAVVYWGDGTQSTVSQDNNLAFVGSHAYAQAGEYSIRVYISDPSGLMAVAYGSATIADAPLTAGGLTLPAMIEDTWDTGVQVFHFTDANPNSIASDFSAVITWGDGSRSTITGNTDPNTVGRITADPNGGFNITGTHRYMAPRIGMTFGVVVSQVDRPDGSTCSASQSNLSVVDAPWLDATLFPPQSAQPTLSHTPLLSFVDTDPLIVLHWGSKSLTAVVDWGDGGPTTTYERTSDFNSPIMLNTVGGQHVITVYGSHTYATLFASTFSVAITDTGVGGQTIASSDVPPTVSSINCAGNQLAAGATSLQFTVNFSEPVTGVGIGDFALSGGDSSGMIASVSGSGLTYTVTVTGISGSGTLGLNLVDDDSIQNAFGTPLAGFGAGNGNFSGQQYALSSVFYWQGGSGSWNGANWHIGGATGPLFSWINGADAELPEGTGTITVSTQTVANSLTFRGDGAVLQGGLVNNGTIVIDAASWSDQVEITANISGPGNVEVINGTLRLSGNNTYTGGTIIHDNRDIEDGNPEDWPWGYVIAGSSTALGTGPLQCDGTLYMNGYSITVGQLSGNGNGAIFQDSLSARLTVSQSTTSVFAGYMQNLGDAEFGLTVTGGGELSIGGDICWANATSTLQVIIAENTTLDVYYTSNLYTFAGIYIGSGGVLNNYGSIYLNGSSITGPGTVHNSGYIY
jgi:autotransporter-associated beta strand protein